MRVPREVRRLALLAAAVGLVVAAAAHAAAIVGTAKGDVLRGTGRADTIYGMAGNDKLYGLGGADTLVGGPGDDLLVGGAGRDVLRCGGGHDTATAAPGDVVAADCEVVTGLPAPTATTTDVSMSEGNSGTGMLSFQVRLSAPMRQAGSVDFATADGTATAGSDYAAASGTLTFKRGETVETIEVAVTGDTAYEPDESLTVTLSNPVHVKLAKATATGRITNDDPAPPPARPGHYAGTYSDGTYFDFEVGSAGTTVYRIAFDFNGHCPGYGTSYGHMTLPGPYLLGSQGSFSVDERYTDSEQDQARFVVAGSVSPNGTAAGSLQVEMAFSDGVSCTTSGTWSAQLR